MAHENMSSSFGSASLTLLGGVCNEAVQDVWTVWTVVRNSLVDVATELADELSAISPFRVRD